MPTDVYNALEDARQYCVELFTDHPRNAGESYCEHFAYAGVTGLKLIGLGLVSVVHSIFPFCCTSTVSSVLPGLSDELESRAAHYSPQESPSNSVPTTRSTQTTYVAQPAVQPVPRETVHVSDSLISDSEASIN